MLGSEQAVVDELERPEPVDQRTSQGEATRPSGAGPLPPLKPRAKPVLPSANRRSGLAPRDFGSTQPGQLSFDFKFRTG